MSLFKKIKMLTPEEAASAARAKRELEEREARRKAQSEALDDVLSKPQSLDPKGKSGPDTSGRTGYKRFMQPGARPGTFKEWSIWYTSRTSVMVKWGVVGKTLQTTPHTFSSVRDADDFYTKIIAQKITKGYEPVGEHDTSL